mgnify:CR=1 FL=1
MSTIKVNTLEEATTGGATFFTAKAWVNFNGTGTVAIRDDGNVSSITDGGTGNYTTNFSSNLSSANYSVTGFSCFFGSSNLPYGLMSMPSNYSITTSSVQTFTVNSTVVSALDTALGCVQVINQ